MQPPIHLRRLAWGLTVLVGLAAAPPAQSQPAPVILDLAEAQATARAHSRKLQDRQDELIAAAHRTDQARARRLPRLGVALRYTRVSHVDPAQLSVASPLPGVPAPAPVQLGEAVDNQGGVRLSLDQPVFTGFSLSSAVDASEHARAAATERKRQELRDLDLQVEETYLGLLQAQQAVEVARQSEALLRELERDAQARLQAGAGTTVEVARSQARRASARVALVQAEGAVELGRVALATLLGVDLNTDFQLADVPVPDEPLPAQATLVTQAEARRPELGMAKAQAAAGAARARSEAGALWPQVWLRAGVNYDRPNPRYFPPRAQFDGSWDVSAVVSWQWDWQATRHGAQAAALEAQVAARKVDDLADAVRLDVARRRQGVVTARARLEATEIAVSAADLALRRSRELCQAGQAPCTAVLDAERDLTQARADRVQARAEARLAHSRLIAATGG